MEVLQVGTTESQALSFINFWVVKHAKYMLSGFFYKTVAIARFRKCYLNSIIQLITKFICTFNNLIHLSNSKISNLIEMLIWFMY